MNTRDLLPVPVAPAAAMPRRSFLGRVAAVVAGAAAVDVGAIVTARPAPSDVVQANVVDSIFSAIDHARRAEEVLAALGENDDTAEALALLGPARSALARTVATTPAGLAALSAFLREADANLCGAAPYFEDADDSAAFNVSLDTAVRGMAGLKPWEGIADRCSESDPILAAIDRVRTANGKLDDVDGDDDVSDSIVLAANNEAFEAIDVLAKTVATTPAGLVALTTFLRDGRETLNEAAADTLFNGDAAEEMAASLDTAVRGMAGLKSWEGVADRSDPVHAAIDRHLTAWRTHKQAVDLECRYETEFCNRRGRLPKRNPHTALRNRTAKDEIAAVFDLAATVPTTAEGLCRLMAHERSIRDEDKFQIMASLKDGYQFFLGTIEVAVCQLAGKPAPQHLLG